MKDERKPMANIVPFGLRMQPQLKARMEEAAKASNRSLNSEIVARLEDSFKEGNAASLRRELSEKVQQMEALQQVLEASLSGPVDEYIWDNSQQLQKRLHNASRIAAITAKLLEDATKNDFSSNVTDILEAYGHLLGEDK